MEEAIENKFVEEESTKEIEKAISKELKALNRRSKKSKDFVEKSNIKHDNKYNYDLVLYENCRSKVKIICPVHEEFEQTPNAHLYAGSGCEKCAREARRKETIPE